ncbi:hypothetical protein BGV57_02960 [Burkholderia ubonensis]|nr:hypothetical protein BGV57_02960 [Burkholderia ubonensis]
MPSALHIIFWKYSREDIKIRTRLKLGECQANHVQQFQTLAILLSEVLGTGTASSTSEPSQENVPKDFADAQRRLAAVFGKR